MEENQLLESQVYKAQFQHRSVLVSKNKGTPSSSPEMGRHLSWQPMLYVCSYLNVSSCAGIHGYSTSCRCSRPPAEAAVCHPPADVGVRCTTRKRWTAASRASRPSPSLLAALNPRADRAAVNHVPSTAALPSPLSSLFLPHLLLSLPCRANTSTKSLLLPSWQTRRDLLPGTHPRGSCSSG